MADRENLFVRTTSSVEEGAERLSRLLELQHVAESNDGAAGVALRGRTRTVDGWLGFLLHPNRHALPHPEPDEVQAIDTYSLQIDIWYGSKDAEVQRREARIVLDLLAAAAPPEPMLLCHALSELVAAYLPEGGVHDFPSGTSMDADGESLWRPWVAA